MSTLETAPPETRPEKPRQTRLNDQAREIAEQFRQSSISQVLLVGAVRLIDVLGVALTAAGAYALLHDGALAAPWPYPVATLAAVVLTLIFAQAADAYHVVAFRVFGGQLGRMLGAWTLTFAGFAVVGSFLDFGGSVERRWLGLWFVLGALSFLISRLVLTALVRRWAADGRLGRKAVIVGGGEPAAELIRALESTPGNDVHICGVFDDRSNDRSPAIVAGYPKLGTVAELVEFGRVARIDLLIVTIPVSAAGRVREILKTLWVLPVDIRLSAHTDKLRYRPRAYSYVGAIPMVELAEKPIANWDFVIKRAFDLIVGTLALIALAPLMIATAIAIKLDSPGPVFFRQKRYGFNNEVIDVFKFRSLRHEMADPDAKTVVTKNDSRVTKVGRFIRKTSIDELPQLFNVLKGELSLVGPRPHAVNAHTSETLWNDVVDGYFARHKVKPGVTGWAQINGWRGEVDTSEKLKRRIDHDLYYIENWSILFDAMILIKTPFALAKTDNAY
ncbi:undecaprenyl-phosphate glucose phosphotransferase [Methylopila jiangsuensis]|uniref:Undecaprenyl-phosphate glucose phosphotransferase n=1 Tax=Methylopila jiangsuensis TaxID=586230 RepID=A0A9W6JDP9_9HYPH|nr:undecaprenyl-phosphate glucose phosphotransferase [Methylopila jiangsuensis]MDR6285904.1 Undecaprenyl-phosphate glucose phosphotransferase [Methylopila jiangsuensis]GLK75661.1 undecaprenyl-phosphate glucose phosphotransferase [Methylopila jiangsuensis]